MYSTSGSLHEASNSAFDESSGHSKGTDVEMIPMNSTFETEPEREVAPETESRTWLLGESEDAKSENSENEATPNPGVPFKSLYVSHLLTTLNSRIFEFGATLFVATLFPGSLREVSVYAIVRSLAAIAFSSQIGTLIDNGDRRTVVRISIVAQRLATCLSYALLLFLTFGATYSAVDAARLAIFGVLCLLAGIEKLSATLNLVAVERDWVPVLAKGDRPLLQQLNTQMRRIDLCCKLGGPLIIGWLEVWSARGALSSMGLVNVVSVVIELVTISQVWASDAALRERSRCARSESESVHAEARNTAIIAWLRRYGKKQWQLHAGYFTSAAIMPSFALALLYCTALSFNGQMVAYLLSVGTSSGFIASYRMFASISELSATWLAPYAMNAIGPVRVGSWSMNLQLLSLLSTASIFWQSIPTVSAAALVIGVIVSRAALWSFDLSAQIIIQEEVEEDRRGTFSATEAMFQNIFELLAFLSTLVWSDVDQFRYPVAGSVFAVFCAAALYAFFVRERRGHLLHLPCTIDSKTRRPLIF